MPLLHEKRTLRHIAFDDAACRDNATVANGCSTKNDNTSSNPAAGADAHIAIGKLPVNDSAAPKYMIMIIDQHVGAKLAAVPHFNSAMAIELAPLIQEHAFPKHQLAVFLYVE